MSSVEFIGPKNVIASDLEPFIEDPGRIPNIVEMGFLDEIQKAVEKLFDIPPRVTFASFAQPPMFSLKKLFREKIISGFDIDKAIAIIDEYLEDNSKQFDQEGEGKGDGDDDEEEILVMLYKLMDLNSLLQDIRNRMQSILKS